MVRLSAIGDCLHAVPLVHALRDAFPDLRIGWAIQPAGHALLDGLPGVDRFHVVPRRGALGDRLAVLADVRRERYEVAIDVQGLAKSALVSWVSGAKRRIGFAKGVGREASHLVATETVSAPAATRHVIARNLCLLEPLGIVNPQVRFELPVDQAAAARVVGELDRVGVAAAGFVVVNPGTTWVTKIWAPENFASVAAGLVGDGHQVVVTWGTAPERLVAAEIAAASGAVLAPATTLRELAELLRQAQLLVASDTGPLHLAAALATPTVAVFGATDPQRNGPWDPEGTLHTVLVREGLECRPCLSRQCRRGDLACLTGLGADRVLAACRQRLRNGRPASC